LYGAKLLTILNCGREKNMTVEMMNKSAHFP